MSEAMRTYIALMADARHQFLQRDYREAQLALNIAEQFWRSLDPSERRIARQLLGQEST